MKKTLKIILITCLVIFACALVACDNSGNSLAPQHSHSYSEWSVTKAATCTENGTKVRFCECGEKQSEIVYAIGHVNGEWITDIEATCTEDGRKHQICSTCKETIKTESISATGHTDGEWIIDVEVTCTENGSKHQICSTCKETIKTESILSTGTHSYTNGVCQICKKYDSYTSCAVVAVKKYYQNYLKNPASLQIHDIKYYVSTENENYFKLDITYSAMNGFGGYNRGYTTIYVRMNGDGTFNYSPYSNDSVTANSYSSTAVKYTDVSVFTNYYFD